MSSINRHGDGEGVTASVRLAVEAKQDYQQRELQGMEKSQESVIDGAWQQGGELLL